MRIPSGEDLLLTARPQSKTQDRQATERRLHLVGKPSQRCLLGRSGPNPGDVRDKNQTHPWPIFPHAKGGDFVDFDEDLKYEDLINGIADGFDNVELLKRYSTVGMGPSQGRHSALPTARIAAKATARPIAEVGVTTARPPVGAEKFAHLAGRAFEPVRLTAMHHRHLEAGAQMMPAGLWMRPAYYGPKEKREEAIAAEVRNVRENVGIIDVSTLGGLEVRGTDAVRGHQRHLRLGGNP